VVFGKSEILSGIGQVLEVDVNRCYHLNESVSNVGRQKLLTPGGAESARTKSLKSSLHELRGLG